MDMDLAQPENYRILQSRDSKKASFLSHRQWEHTPMSHDVHFSQYLNSPNKTTVWNAIVGLSIFLFISRFRRFSTDMQCLTATVLRFPNLKFHLLNDILDIIIKPCPFTSYLGSKILRINVSRVIMKEAPKHLKNMPLLLSGLSIWPVSIWLVKSNIVLGR